MNKYTRHLLRFIKDGTNIKNITKIKEELENNPFSLHSLMTHLSNTENEILVNSIQFLKSYANRYDNDNFNGEIILTQYNRYNELIVEKTITFQNKKLKQILRQIYDLGINCISLNKYSTYTILFEETCENNRYPLILFSNLTNLYVLYKELIEMDENE